MPRAAHRGERGAVTSPTGRPSDLQPQLERPGGIQRLSTKAPVSNQLDGLDAATGPALAGQVVDLTTLCLSATRDAERQRTTQLRLRVLSRQLTAVVFTRWGALAALVCARSEARAQMMKTSTAITRIAHNGE